MLVLKRLLCLILSLLDVFVVSQGKGSFYMKRANVDITINTECEKQVIDGFGTSACWWAQTTGGSQYADETARALYSKDGLGLNIYRYNIGGGEKDNPNSRVRGNRATESFYYYNEATGEYEYDFTRDAAAQEMMDKCLSYGCIDTVVLFANSPHYSMTVSGSAAGGYETNVSNLPAENYEAYSDYFLTITEYFLSKGIPVKYISPINEPQWSWGGDWVGQEGCHYEEDEVIALFKVFAKALKQRNLPVKLMGPESGEVGDITVRFFDALTADDDIKDVLGTLAYHSYWSDDYTLRKIEFGKTVNKKYSDIPVAMTEWCELPCAHNINDFDSALLMARVISQDLGLSNANSWTAWVGVNNYGINENGEKISDGMLVANDEYTELYTATRYYAMAHYSKYIPVGSVRVSAITDIVDLSVHGNKEDKENRVATKYLNLSAYKTPEGKTVCVLVNEGEARTITMNITEGDMQIITSTADSYLKTTYQGAATEQFKIPSKSITTIIYG